jgi:hypothetical protein
MNGVSSGEPKSLAKQRATKKRSDGVQADHSAAGPSAALKREALLGPLCRLPIPPEVEEAVEREVAKMAAQGRPVVGKARERLLEDSKLSYYFGGQPLAYRETSQGKEILAVGFKDIRRLLKDLSPEDAQTIVSDSADPW